MVLNRVKKWLLTVAAKKAGERIAVAAISAASAAGLTGVTVSGDQIIIDAPVAFGALAVGIASAAFMWMKG